MLVTSQLAIWAIQVLPISHYETFLNISNLLVMVGRSFVWTKQKFWAKKFAINLPSNSIKEQYLMRMRVTFQGTSTFVSLQRKFCPFGQFSTPQNSLTVAGKDKLRFVRRTKCSWIPLLILMHCLMVCDGLLALLTFLWSSSIWFVHKCNLDLF